MFGFFRDPLDLIEERNRHEEEMARLGAHPSQWFKTTRRRYFVPSSGNVWRDLGFPDADERQAAADARIAAIKQERREKALRPEDV